ncbi:MAG: four helix bundle protein [Phycisphaerales bacterium JB063]
MDSKGYRSLLVWQRGMEMVEAVYRLTDKMSDSERYGLISQMQRSAVSVPSNIAEGYARTHTGDYLKHLSYARGSLAELETQIIAAVRVDRIQREHAVPSWELCQEVGKMLTGLIKKVAQGRTSS